MAILASSDGLVGAVVVLVFDLTKCAEEEKYILVPPSILTSSNQNAAEKQNEGSKAIA